MRHPSEDSYESETLVINFNVSVGEMTFQPMMSRTQDIAVSATCFIEVLGDRCDNAHVRDEEESSYVANSATVSSAGAEAMRMLMMMRLPSSKTIFPAVLKICEHHRIQR